MNKAAQSLGRRAKGVRKNYSPEELQKRRERFGKAAAAVRWAKTKPQPEPNIIK